MTLRARDTFSAFEPRTFRPVSYAAGQEISPFDLPWLGDQSALVVDDAAPVEPVAPETASAPESVVDAAPEPEPAPEAAAEPQPEPEVAQAPAEDAAPAFDPAAHTAKDVLAYAKDHPDQVGAVIDAEKSEGGKGRGTLLVELERLRTA